jgi:hypothetical protein
MSTQTMRLNKVLTLHKLARTGKEAERLIKQGAVWVGGCKPGCSWFTDWVCNCNEWTKVVDPFDDVAFGAVVKVKDGNWRCIPRIDGTQGFDQLPGICRVGEK